MTYLLKKELDSIYNALLQTKNQCELIRLNKRVIEILSVDPSQYDGYILKFLKLCIDHSNINDHISSEKFISYP